MAAVLCEGGVREDSEGGGAFRYVESDGEGEYEEGEYEEGYHRPKMGKLVGMRKRGDLKHVGVKCYKYSIVI